MFSCYSERIKKYIDLNAKSLASWQKIQQYFYLAGRQRHKLKSCERGKYCLKTWSDLDYPKGLAKVCWCQVCHLETKLLKFVSVAELLFSGDTGDTLRTKCPNSLLHCLFRSQHWIPNDI